MGRLRQPALFGAVIEGESDTVVLDVSEDDPDVHDGRVIEHEAEDGTTFADHVVLDQASITLRGILTDTPFTAPPEDGRALGMYRSLLNMRNNRERVAIITELQVFDPAVIYSIARDPLRPAQAAIGVTIQAKVVRIVSPERVFLPPERVRDEPAGTRDRATEEQDDGQQGTDPLDQADAAAAAQAVSERPTALRHMSDTAGGILDLAVSVASGGGF